MDAVSALKKLVRATGPINTFYVGASKTEPGRWYGAYAQLRITPKGHLVNTAFAQAAIEPSYAPEATYIAKKEGRVECKLLGRFRDRRHFIFGNASFENIAAAVIVDIASKAQFRSKHKKAVTTAFKTVKEGWVKRRLSLPDPRKPDTLGWRVWYWDSKIKKLISPSQRTIWHTPELRVPVWSARDVVRGVAGIHAALMPHNWRQASLDNTELDQFNSPHEIVIPGVVERFGKYILGTIGWRAEWVIIKALKAPSTEIGLALEQAYPDVEVYYDSYRT